LDEHEAAARWALAYNTHDPAVLEGVLADDVRVTSRWVITDMVGRDTYLDYLRVKFDTFERHRSMVRVELARAPAEPAWPKGRPCALIEQDGSVLATVLFEVSGGRITQVALGDRPPPAACRRSGAYPGFDRGGEPVN
jgi:hypothetical protein